MKKERSELSSVKLLEAEGHSDVAIVADQLESQVNALELSLLAKIPDLSQGEHAIPTWQIVQRALKQRQAVIEIARFNYNTGVSYYSFTQPRYVALVLTNDMRAPSLVNLGSAEILEHAAWQDYVRSLNGELSTGAMDKLVWEPIRRFIGGATEIYLVPDGILNKVAFGAIIDDTGAPLLSHYRFSILSNSGDLVGAENAAKPSARKTAVLIGNPAFEASGVASEDQGFREVGALAPSVPIAELPGTAAEVRNLDSILRTNGWAVESFTGQAATKAVVRSLNRPRLLHIATHGYFISESEARAMAKNMPTWYPDDVLIRTGLFFAGSSSGTSSGQTTGILTAYEASGLSLSGTELVVLSACDTGLGETANGEGVLGLRRALREAGARAVLMSLWSVPDRETEELMTAFYTKWLGGMEMHEALRASELELRERVIARYGRDIPRYWAGFVLSD